MTITALALAGMAPASSPIAEIVCAPTPDMKERLARQYDSRRRGFGTSGHEQVLEVWADERGTWTMVMTYATGTSCIVAMGENWEGLADNPA